MSNRVERARLAVWQVNCYRGFAMGTVRLAGVALDGALSATGGEAALVAELQAGSEEAFAYLLAVYQNPIYSTICHIVEDGSDAGDVLQDVFVKVFRGIGRFHRNCTLKTWIYRIAVHEATNHRRGWLRRHLREVFSLDEDVRKADWVLAATSASPETPYEVLEQGERQQCVRQALASLSQPYRTVVVLREIEELSYEEIAQVLGISEGTVKSRLVRGRELLKRKLASRLGSE